MSFPGKDLLIYRPAEALLVDVEDELSKYTNNNLIDRSALVKIIVKCNAQLGLKIFKEKESVVSVSNYKSELPIDFYKFNYGLLCSGIEYQEAVDYPKRELTEVTKLDPNTRYHVDPCSVKNLCCKDYVVTETQKFRTIKVHSFLPVALKNTRRDRCDEECPNWSFKSNDEISIVGDELQTNFKSGYIYLNYTGLMEDQDGGLIVLDHPLINDYYEAALKFKAFDIMEDNGENVSNLRAKWEAREEKHRRIADNIVSTPEYEEVAAMWAKNRKKVYDRFYWQVFG